MVARMLYIFEAVEFIWERTPDDLDWDDPDGWDSEDWEFLEPPDLDKWWPEAIDPED